MNAAYEPVYLVMVTAGGNHNKFYRMIPKGNRFVAEYGRIGTDGFQKREYDLSCWHKKYNEKIKKGYQDRSALVRELIEKEEPAEKKYRDIDDVSVAEIVRILNEYATNAVATNYKVGAHQVTQAMIDCAQILIDNLAQYDNGTTVKNFNSVLIEIFETIPRKMHSVSDYLAENKRDFAEIVQREQDLLDTMRTQVYQKSLDTEEENTDSADKPDKTILEAMGLDMRPVTDEEEHEIKSQLGKSKERFMRAWRVVNRKTQACFDEFVKQNDISDIRMLWHGSRNENWWSIINSGLVLRPSAVITGKMFGYGIYYAPCAEKSIGYTSVNGSYWARGHETTGYMALMDVAYGTPFDVHSYGDYGALTYEKLQQKCPGANSLHAHAGNMLKNDEIVVYKEEQSTIKYLVEIA